mgnify:CR=1 FL=1
MNHHEIEQQDIIERYVRHQLKPEERRAFQEHYFACDECFAAVESTAKFIAGVQRSSRVGVLAENAREVASASVAPWWASFFKPAFAFGAMACLLLAVALGWLVLRQPSGPGGQVAKNDSTPAPTVQATQTPATPAPSPQASTKDTPKVSPTPEDKDSRKDLDDKLARNDTPAPRGNVTIALAESRGSGAKSSAKISPELATITLRAEVEPDRSITYQMQILDSGGRTVKMLSNLHASASGALAVSVPAKSFSAGKYSVKLYRLKNQQRDLVGDYVITLQN